MSTQVYEAAVYTREVKYRNLNGEEKTEILHFALDPMELMRVIAGFAPKKIKSGNPAMNGRDAEITPEEQLKFLHDLVCKAAGIPSRDGEEWTPIPEFSNWIVGKAFLAQMAASDGIRREIANKVVLAPFEAFVGFAKADPSNSPADIKQLDTMMVQMRNVFSVPDERDETLDEKRARLAAEMAALDSTPSNVTPLPPAGE